jgi:putative transposase
MYALISPVYHGSTRLVNGRPLKSISFYWRKKISEYQSMLNKYGLETSRRLGRMYVKWRRQIKHYIDARVREAVEWLYDVGVSTIKVGYPKGITQENGDFDNVNVWTYGLLLRRIREVAEEYGIKVIYVDERGTSSRCPWHGNGCDVRIHRGLFKCTRLGKVFNADLMAAHNILIMPVTPESWRGIGGNGRRPGQGLNLPRRRGVAQTSPHQVGEEVRHSSGQLSRPCSI